MSSSIEPQHSRTGTGRAHAKVILFGEHAVVYGYPAIAVPLDSLAVDAQVERATDGHRIESAFLNERLLGSEERFDAIPLAAVDAACRHFGVGHDLTVRITSAVPPGRGLGSSAAISTAIVRAIADLADRELGAELCFELVQHAERVAHGTPSGLDARATAAPGPIRFQSGSSHPITVNARASFLIADTGIHGNTRHAVADVRAFREGHPERAVAILDRLGALTGEVERLLGMPRQAADSLTLLGGLMDEAQGLLAELGVSSPEITRLNEAARGAGALGAKLSGGGQGGCIVALLPHAEASATVEQALREAGAAGIYRFDTRTF